MGWLTENSFPNISAEKLISFDLKKRVDHFGGYFNPHCQVTIKTMKNLSIVEILMLYSVEDNMREFYLF